MRNPVLPLVAVCAAWGVFWGSWSALLPAVKEQLGTSAAGLGLALAATPVGAIPAMALAGRLARGRERGALMLCTALFALSVLAVGRVATPAQLALALLAVGATSGALDVALNMATGRAERESGRRLFQPVHAAFPVAVIAAAPATGLARDLGAGTAAVLVTAAVIVLGAAATVLALPMGRGLPPAGGDGHRRRWTAAIVLGLLAAGVLAVENAVEQWSVLLLETHQGASPLLASAAPAAYMAALTAGRLVVHALPRLSDRTLYLVAGAGGGGGIALAGLAGTPLLSLAGFALTGLALGPVVPAMLSRAAAADPTGALVSALSAISYTGFVVSPLLVAVLAAWLGLPAALAALGLLAVPLVVTAVSRRALPE
ncbi:MFS transporter [Nonomuraea sp. SBT364]|uniref:MFS transporter n=1 Tax=Nonomuraea sp. SBT364 TaxID=1580530 RepID=UPI00066BBB25|nr:MFS transporter [Nonomuraea sp. SBT364]